MRLVLAMTEMHLSPLVASGALVELDTCLEALLDAWGPGASGGGGSGGSGGSGSTRRGRQLQAAEPVHGLEDVWQAVAMQVGGERGVSVVMQVRGEKVCVGASPGCNATTLDRAP